MFLYDSGVNLKLDYFNELNVMNYTHIHPRYEMYFCTQAVEQVSIINGVEYRYRHPAVIFSAPYTLHSMSCGDEPSGTYERYVFYFGEKTADAFDSRYFSKKMLEKDAGLLYELTEAEAAELSEIVRLCHKCTTVDEKELVFALFVNRLTSICPPERIQRVGTQAFYIREVLKYITENLNEKLNIMDMSERFAVSRSKLDRDFKRFTGITVHNYIDICRVNQAKYLLGKRERMSVSEVAAACGFESESCFFHFFKRVTGSPPSEFRRKKV